MYLNAYLFCFRPFLFLLLCFLNREALCIVNSISPRHENVVSAESLSDSAVAHGSRGASPKHFPACLCDHCAVVDAEAHVRRVQSSLSFAGHDAHHLLQSLVASHTTHNKHLGRVAMRHCSLSNFNEHRKDRLLERKAKVFPCALARRKFGLGNLFDERGNPRKCDIHAFHRVGQLDIFFSFLGELFDIVPWTRIVGDLENSCKTVKAIADCNVNRLAEDAVPLLRVRNDLCVSPTDVKNGGVPGSRDQTPHLDMADAVIDSHERLAPKLCNRTCNDSKHIQRSAHSRPFGEAYTVNVSRMDRSLLQRPLEDPEDCSPVMPRSVPGLEPGPRWRDIRLPDIAEDLAIPHNAHSNLVGTALKSDRYRHGGQGGQSPRCAQPRPLATRPCTRWNGRSPCV
mmetsp:Transcript_35397/g.92612  ORF Transcript_35397/g.92612 Transcript_35397/m.92612 type:complete len:398 (-) Transcript_35397:111-1304(-)